MGGGNCGGYPVGECCPKEAPQPGDPCDWVPAAGCEYDEYCQTCAGAAEVCLYTTFAKCNVDGTLGRDVGVDGTWLIAKSLQGTCPTAPPPTQMSPSPSPPPPSPSPPPPAQFVPCVFNKTSVLKEMVEAYNTDPGDAKRIAAIEKCGLIGDWDVSAITDMSNLFNGMLKFNEPISNWVTSSVTDMSYMFKAAYAFDQPLNFDTSKVTDMSWMFDSAVSFNQPLSFDTRNVTDMSEMFAFAKAFDQRLSFDTPKVTTMSSMFKAAYAFDQPLNFDTSKVTDMSGMFYNAKAFNQPLRFVTSSVTDMTEMFQYAVAFNQPLSFDTPKVAFGRMRRMFDDAVSLSSANKLLIRCAFQRQQAGTLAFAQAGYDLLWGPGNC